MSLTANIVLWLVLGTFALTAHAHELSEGTGIVCDTPDQVQRLAVLGAKPEAIKTINDGAAKAVCALTTVRYIRGRRLDLARAAFDICTAQKPEQTITLRLKAQVIEESTPKG